MNFFFENLKKKFKRKKLHKLLIFSQFQAMRMIYHHHQPYAWPSCPSSCEEGFTADWKQWCSCPVLYFILSPEYVRLLPSFREQYWGGVMGRQPTNLAPVTFPAVTHTPIDFGS